MRYLSPLGKLVFSIFILALLAIGGLFAFFYKPAAAPLDYKNIAYMINGQQVVLQGGVSEVPQAGSASKVVTRYFGNEAKGDLNGDGIPDLAFLLTQTTGGSGTFFYVVGAIQNADGGYSGSDGVLLGDRVAPQPTEIRDGKVIANYADRAPGEPMTTQPSIGKSIYLKLDPKTMQFGIVVQDFEGESAYAEECRESPEYFIITRGRTDVGEDILVKPKVPGRTYSCHYAVESGDIELADAGPTYVLGIEGNFLILDSGTAPPPRGLGVFDLGLKKNVYSDRYNKPFAIEKGTIRYWQPFGTEKDLNAENCPSYGEYKAQGLGAGLEREVVLNLSTLKITTVGETRCSARQ